MRLGSICHKIKMVTYTTFFVSIKGHYGIKTISIYRRLTMNLIKVAGTSRTAAVAGAIAGIVREHHRAEVQAIGAGAVNQAMKALILATGYLELDGIQIRCVPEFIDVTIDENVRTAIKLVIEVHHAPNTAIEVASRNIELEHTQAISNQIALDS
jgi:stage V sporulation protein S